MPIRVPSRWDLATRFAKGSDGRSAVVLGLATLLGPLGGFVANIVYARTLGPSGRGDLAAVVAAIAICEVVLVFGFTDVLTRHMATRSMPAGALRKVALLGIVASLLPGLLVGMFASRHGFEATASVAAALVVPLATVASLGRGVLAGRRAFGWLAAALTCGGIARVLSPVILILVDSDEPDLALVLIVASTAIAAVPVRLTRTFRDPGHGAQLRFRSLAAQALGIWPASLSWSLNSRLDQLVLAAMLPAAELGRYAVCVTLAELPVVLAAGARQIVLVRTAEAGTARKVIGLTRLVLIAGMMVGATALVISDPVMVWVFGASFGGTSVVLACLLLSSAFVISSGLINSSLIALGRGSWTIASQCTGLVVSVTLLFTIIPNGGGIVAAGLISVATYAAVYLASMLLLFRSDRELVAERISGP